jgi:hypothetical protein
VDLEMMKSIWNKPSILFSNSYKEMCANCNDRETCPLLVIDVPIVTSSAARIL